MTKGSCPTPGVSLRCFLSLLVFFLIAAAQSRAGTPEYMRLSPPMVGQGIEIKGRWDSSGVFIAHNLELLPKARKPKLRGEIQAIDRKRQTITVYGREIKVNKKTSFLDDGGEAVTFDQLKTGQRIEVSCKVDEQGNWRARKIQTHGIKESDKIKGTITELSVDGHPPDTISINDLLIILERGTDVEDPRSHLFRSEKMLLGDLSRNGPEDMKHGYPLGDRLVLSAQYRHQFRNEADFDLSNRPFDETNTQPDVRLEATGFWTRSIRTFTQLRLRKRYALTSDIDTIHSGPLQAQFTQLYVLLRDFGPKGLALQVGRQDFDETREWLFDEYLDAVRVFYYGIDGFILDAAVIHTVDALKPKASTWTDYFVRSIWLPTPENEFTAYLFLRTDTDIRNREPVWWGLRYNGHPRSGVRSWAEFSLMRGEDKGRTLRAWAMDLGSTLSFEESRLSPAFTASYAIGSGDKSGDPENQTFRQTGYQDNVDKLGGITAVQYYGSVLAPELSNLKILTLAGAMRPTRQSSIEILYHSYKQHRPGTVIKGSDLIDPPAQPNGSDTDIGWGLDVVTAFPKLWERVRVKWTLGYFNPGRAFGAGQENAILNKINISMGF